MDEGKCTFEEAVTLSLDEYQAKYLKHSNFKAKELPIMTNTEQDIDMVAPNNHIKDKFAQTNYYSKRGSRSRWNHSPNPKKSYVNWRLRLENVVADKPLLMPPLIPIGYNSNHLNNNKRNQTSSRNNSNNNRRGFNKNREKNPKKLWKNDMYMVQNTNSNLSNNSNRLKNIRNNNFHNSNRKISPAMFSNAGAFAIKNSNSLEVIKPTTSLTRSDFQTNWSSNEMAAIAGTLLAKIEAFSEIKQNLRIEEERKNKYDLVVQKEIATLQNKQLFVKCPSSEVVTCDGPGLNDCRPTPNSTPLSMNLRFA